MDNTPLPNAILIILMLALCLRNYKIQANRKAMLVDSMFQFDLYFIYTVRYNFFFLFRCV